MTFLDYLIVAVVAVLFVLALIIYRKKPHCSCGNSGGCSGNCAQCSSKCSHNDGKVTQSGKTGIKSSRML